MKDIFFAVRAIPFTPDKFSDVIYVIVKRMITFFKSFRCTMLMFFSTSVLLLNKIWTGINESDSHMWLHYPYFLSDIIIIHPTMFILHYCKYILHELIICITNTFTYLLNLIYIHITFSKTLTMYYITQ